MVAYVLACEQTGVPSIVTDSSGGVSVVCSSGSVSFIEYQSSIFVPLSVADATLIATAVALLWASAWVFRLLSNFIERKSHEEP